MHTDVFWGINLIVLGSGLKDYSCEGNLLQGTYQKFSNQQKYWVIYLGSMNTFQWQRRRLREFFKFLVNEKSHSVVPETSRCAGLVWAVHTLTCILFCLSLCSTKWNNLTIIISWETFSLNMVVVNLEYKLKKMCENLKKNVYLQF